MFIVQFHSILERDDALEHNVVYYDKKPLVMKSWTIGKTIREEDIAGILVWATFPELDFKFLSEGLSK